MAITPIDIQQHQFKNQLFGYDKASVDRFLELVAEELERHSKQYQEVREELARTKATVDEMRQREAILKETLLTAQKVTEDLKNNAQREAEVIIADARVKAEQIVREAEDRRLQLISEIQESKRQKVAFETGLRSLVESHLRLLDLDVFPLDKEEKSKKDRLLEEPGPFEDLSELLHEDEDEEGERE